MKDIQRCTTARLRLALTWTTTLSIAAAFALVGSVPIAFAGESAYVAPKDKAFVVFLRDRFVDRKMQYFVVDENRQCLAIMDDKKAERIPMKPGKHTMYAMGGNARRVDMDLDAGRTYFVRIYSHTAMAKGIVGVTPVKRGTEAFDQLPSWTKDLRTSDPGDECRGVTIDDKRGRVQKRIDRTRADWESDSEEERAKFTLDQKDGLTRKEAAKL